jgi:hypothetical protein
MLMGSPAYMAPELLSDSADIRADIYSLGIVMYEMLAGSAPFQHETPWAVLQMHASREAPSVALARPDIPDHVARIVDRCLEKEPARRFQTPDELLTTLRSSADATLLVSTSGNSDSGKRLGTARPPEVSTQLVRAVHAGAAGAKLGIRGVGHGIRLVTLLFSAVGLMFLVALGVASTLLILMLLPGSKLSSCMNSSGEALAVQVSEEHSATWQQKWKAFYDGLEAGQPGEVTFNNDEMSSRAVLFFLDEANELEDVVVCFNEGSAVGSASVHIDTGLFERDLDVRMEGVLDFSSDSPTLKLSALKLGKLPVPGFLRGTITGLVNDAMTKLEVRHKYEVTFEPGRVLVRGEP